MRLEKAAFGIIPRRGPRPAFSPQEAVLAFLSFLHPEICITRSVSAWS